MEFELSEQIFENPDIKFHENSSSGSRLFPCGRTDRRAGRQAVMTNLKVTFRNYAKAPKSPSVLGISWNVNLSVIQGLKSKNLTGALFSLLSRLTSEYPISTR
jgi:hypothetical protein